MYFNNIHVLWYLLVIILGGIVGQIVDYSSKIFIEEGNIISKKNIKKYLSECIPNYILMTITSILYIGLLYTFGDKNLTEVIKCGLLIPMLLTAFIVDYKIQIIPNRLNLTIFETGLIFTFIYAIMNINVARDLFFGMLIGGGIFLVITLIGGLIAGKEAMGLRRCKINGCNRLIFWI